MHCEMSSLRLRHISTITSIPINSCGTATFSPLSPSEGIRTSDRQRDSGFVRLKFIIVEPKSAVQEFFAAVAAGLLRVAHDDV